MNLVRSFVDIVSKNGNLLLNIGPTAEGQIPELQLERLLGLGRWLDVNGEAIFDTRPWQVAESKTSGDVDVRFTQKGETLYATLLETPQELEIVIQGLCGAQGTSVRLLGDEAPLIWEQRDAGLATAAGVGSGAGACIGDHAAAGVDELTGNRARLALGGMRQAM